MSDYKGLSCKARVRVKSAVEHWLDPYVGQECDAIIYPQLASAMLDTEQLNPPLPKYQTVGLECVEVIAFYQLLITTNYS